MNRLLDKLVLFTLCLAVFLLKNSGLFVIVPVIAAVAAAGGVVCLENEKAKLFAITAYCAACVFFAPLLYFLPVLCYDVPSARWKWLFPAAAPVITAFYFGNYYAGIMAVLLAAAGRLMAYRTETLEKAVTEYLSLRDSAKEQSLRLEGKNRELLQKQDYEVNLATLRERNRIARDIHDGVGHLLSSAILQIGAIMATSGDEAEKQRLKTVKETLSQGMDSIRSSVHGLYEESFDLYTEARSVIGKFKFCPVAFSYHVEKSPDQKTEYAFIAIIKEALANTAKHSGASAVSIVIREQPAFYSLVIKDNGKGFDRQEQSDGIGLRSMSERVDGIGGMLNIDGKNGFNIFITVPKGRGIK